MANLSRAAVAAVSLMLCSVAADAAVLVVRSSGPSARSFPAGRALPDKAPIALKANDMLVLLDSRGTRTLRGPGNFDASASAAAAGSALSAVTAQNNSRRVRIQAVRGGPTGATQGRNVWQADVARSGPVCVASPADLGLYRADTSREADVTVRDGTSGNSAVVHFEPGQNIAPWPSSLPVARGGKFKLVGMGNPATLDIRMLTPVPAGLEGIAQSFITHGCQAQLDVLIDTFTSPSAS